MALRITVLPASTKAGNVTISELLASPSKPFVRAVYRDASKAPAEFTSHPNFEAVNGDVSVASSLNFAGSDVVFYVPPPIFDGTDVAEFATNAANNVKKALQEATSVKKLLILSATGSQHDHGIGYLRINYISDTILKDAVSQVLIVRPGYFLENWAPVFEGAQAEVPLLRSPMTPIDHKLPMVSLIDVGVVCAQALLDEEEKASPYFFSLHGPQHYSTTDLKLAVEEVTGKKWEIVAIPRDNLAAYWADQVPAVYVEDFVEMTTCGLPGGIADGEAGDSEHIVNGKVELVDALRKVYSA